MVERIKNKKGFTIIEIMVVIALIGILAAVLVPKFGGIKDRAKDAGMLTNAKMVEAYVASVVDGYADGEEAALVTAITNQFSGANALTDPYTATPAPGNIVVDTIDVGAYSTGEADDADAGKIYVLVSEDNKGVFINGFNSTGTELQATRRNITK